MALFEYRHISGSFNVAKQTLELLRLICSGTKWANAKALMDTIKALGKRLIEAQPLGMHTLISATC